MGPLAIAMGLKVAGGVMKMFATAEESKAQQKQMKRQALWEERLAAYSYQQGAFQAAMADLAASKSAGTARTQMAVSGTDADPSTLAESAFLAEWNKTNIITGAARAALGHKLQAQEYRTAAHRAKSMLPFQILFGSIETGAGVMQMNTAAGPSADVSALGGSGTYGTGAMPIG